MTIRLNGIPRELPDPCPTVGALLASLGIRPGRVAVEVNGAIIDPALFETAALHENDRVEIVSFVGGG